MKISDMLNVLAEIQRGQGDLEVYCGRGKIRGFAIYPGTPEAPARMPGDKIVSILAYYEQPAL